MKNLQLKRIFATCLIACGIVALHSASADVLTQRGNSERTGSVSDSGLNQSAVGNPRWGELGRLPVNGVIYAQPLIVEQLSVPGSGPRDVVFVATGSNGLYAFDARSLHPIWALPQIAPNDKSATGKPGCDGISLPGGIGIEATPVIDRVRNTMFISYRTNASGNYLGAAQQRLRSLDIRDGHVLQDVLIEPPGAAADWTVWHRNRAGLLLDNGVVYLGFVSRCEDQGTPMFNGRVLGFDATTLRPVASYSPTADQGVDGGGIWQGAGGLAADGQGNIYIATGNRRRGVDQVGRDAPNLADSIVKLSPALTRAGDGSVLTVKLQVVDFFTPYRKVWLDDQDLDLAAAGPVLLPNTNYLVAGGKSGVVYLLDRNNMGKLDSAHAWTGAMTDALPLDAVDTEYADDVDADHVVQKFQAAFNQYVPRGSPDMPRAGAPITAAAQNDSQIDAFAVGRDGAVEVWWQVGNAPWTDRTAGRPGPISITPAGLAPPMAHVVTANQGNKQLDAFVVGNDGALHVAWETSDGPWAFKQGGITAANLAPPGAPIATATQGANQLDVFTVGNDGAVHVASVVGGGAWATAPGGITPAGLSLPGSGVAAASQNAAQLDLFTIGRDGAIHVAWVVGGGAWVNGTSGITPAGVAPSNAYVAAAKQGASQLDAFVAGNDGAVHVVWEQNNSSWVFEAAGITPQHFTPPGACLSTALQSTNQLDVFFVGNDGAVYATFVDGSGHWSDGSPGQLQPSRLTPAAVANPGSCVAPIRQSVEQLDALVVGRNGAPLLTWETKMGRWRDNWNGFAPTSLGQAVWMNGCWPCWPHIHGSPVFAEFPNHRDLMYVWPEKDHLKAYAWMGDHLDAAHPILGVTKQGGLVVAPPGPPFGMPGGMLAVAIDPAGPDRGLLLASVPRPEGMQMNGMLRIFDPVSLHEIWNNAGTEYGFAKFVPPTAGAGRVYLPTTSGFVLVYGLRGG